VTLGALFLWLPRRYAPMLPALVALGFVLTWLPLQLWIHSFPRLSAAALPAALPFLGLLNINAQSDTPFLQPWWYLGDRVAGLDNVSLLVVATSVTLGALFLWLPRRYAPMLPALVALGFFLTWLPLQLWIHSFPRLSAAAYSTGIGAERAWIDKAVGSNADVTLLYSGDNPYRGWENEFWNRSVRRVYDFGTPPLIAGGGEEPLTVQQSTGRLVDPRLGVVQVKYVLADPSVQIVGEKVAEDPAKGMAVYRVDGVLRTSTLVNGWYGDTWTKPRFDWTRRECTAGLLRVQVHSDSQLFAGVTQHIAISGSTAPFTFALPSTATKTIVVHLQPQGGVCQVRFAVTPSRRPPSDVRRLGVLVSGFEYVPAAE
jgi:hypothetical protein